MRFLVRSAAAVLTTTIVVGASATSALAQSTTVKDKASDVISYADENDQQGSQLGLSDSVATGTDVRSMVVKHGNSTVSVMVKFRELKRETAVSVAFRPGGSSEPNRVLLAVAGDRSGEVFTTSDKKVCGAKVTTKLGTGGYVKASVKRSCLGTPKKLKASAAAVRYDAATGRLAIDAVSPSNIANPSSSRWIKAGS